MTASKEKLTSGTLEERYKLILESQNDLVYIINQKLEIEYCNEPVFKRVLGYTEEDLKRNKILFAIHPEDKKEALQAIKEGIKKKEGVATLRLRDKKGEYHFHEFTGKLFTDYDGTQKALIIAKDISSHIKSEIGLKESEELYRLISENSNDLIRIFDKNSTYRYVNEATHLKQLGYTRDELIGMPAKNILHPDEEDEYNKDYEILISTGEMRREARVLHKDGHWVWFDIWGKVIDNTEENWRGIIISRNIDERKKAEEKFKKFFKGSPIPTYAWQKVGEDFILIDYNDAAVKITQSGVEKFIGVKASEMYRTRSELLEDIMRCFEEKVDIEHEMKYIMEISKQEKDLLVKYVFLPPDLVLVQTEDITDRKIAEEKIKESEEKYRTLSEQSFLGIAILQDDFIRYVNKQLASTFGYSIEEIMAWGQGGFLNVIYPEDRIMVAEQATKKQQGDSDIINQYQFRGIRKNGDIIWLEVFSKTITYRGKPADFVTIHDITDEKITEQKIKESEEKYRNLFNNAPFAIVLFTIEGIILDCNDSTQKITGYSKDELIGHNFKNFNFYVDPTSANLEERTAKTSAGKIPEVREIQLYKKEGTQFWARTHIEFIYLRGETYIQAILHDVTEQKESTIRLNESESRLQERVNELNFLYGISEIIESQNLSLEDLINEVVILIPTAMQFPDRARVQIKFDRQEFKSHDFRATRWKLVNHITINEKPLDIEIFYLEDKPFLPEEENLIIELGKRLKNFLEKKESEQERRIAQEELKESYEKLKELEKIINNSPGIGILWKNSEGWPVEFVSDNVNQWGYTPQEFYSGNVIYAEIIHPDDLERVTEEVGYYSNEDINEFVQEYRIITKSGEVKWLDDRTWIRRDSNGNITHFQGVAFDITDRKIAEEALKESEKKFKEAYDQASFYKDLFTHDINNILQVVNSSAELISYQLGSSEKSKDISNIANIIKKQVDRGSKLVSNVRTLSIIEDEQFSTKSLEISRYLENSIDFIEKTYEDRNVKITVDGLNGKYEILGNELIQDVFENILINSIKYNENPNVEIAIRLSKIKIDDKTNFKIEFSDNGIGVPDDRKTAIFLSGNREFKGRKGMGLGLSLVSKILNLFNGKIWVEDKIKGDYTQGSNFILVLPEAK
ncbi:MAG: PAS domain S-box protein [Promethearchaeota archaeon]